MIPVIIMAGGRGLRLHPLTEKTPKPLLQVGRKPLLETIIDGFAEQGFRKFWLCLGYKAGLIQAHFGNGEGRGIKIRYVVETQPLGTAGALKLLPEFDVPFIVSNADVLARVKYGHLMDAHARSNADATVCLALHQRQVPFGVAETDDMNRLLTLREKPIHSWAVNAGLYVLNPGVRDKAEGDVFDMPDLIARLDDVNTYAIEDFWLDVGHFESLARANAELSQ